ncbi:hypothetical protein, partial [Klebsiella pneumoniae]
MRRLEALRRAGIVERI